MSSVATQRDTGASQRTLQHKLKCLHEGCDKLFGTQGQANKHFLENHGDKLVKCLHEGCDKLFGTQGRVNWHFLATHGGGHHPCEFQDCHKMFVTDSSLKQHQLIHTGVKTYVCTSKYCLMSFRTNGQLKAHSFWNHTGNVMQSKKKQENIVAKALEEDGLGFERSHFVSHSCSIEAGALETGEGKPTWVTHDLMLHGINVVVFVEIDEHQHSHYGTPCEVSRMAKTVECQIIDEKRSLQALCTLVRSLVDKRERETVYTIYFNYDSQERTSSNMHLKDLKTLSVIFDDDDYQDSVKEWLFLNIIPEDYMNIHVVQLDDSGEQSSVMKIDDLGDESSVCRDYRPTNCATLKGMYFVLTGQPKYMIRAELTTLIRAYKGNVRTTVSDKPQFLVKGPNSGDSNERKAKELKVHITDEDGLFLLITGGVAALESMVAQEKAGLVSNSNSMEV